MNNLINILRELKKLNYVPSNSVSCLILTLNINGLITIINLLEFLLEYLTYSESIPTKKFKFFDINDIQEAINMIKKHPNNEISPFMFSKRSIKYIDKKMLTDFNHLFDININERDSIIKKYVNYFKENSEIENIYKMFYYSEDKKLEKKRKVNEMET